MKKIAILGSGSEKIFEAVAEYFDGKEVELTCLSDELNSDILKCAQKLGIKYRYLPYESNAEYFGSGDFDLVVLAEYSKALTEETLSAVKVVNAHPSLLPAFKGDEAIRRAYTAGVKVSGVTVHWISNEPDGGKIIAQYPVLIPNLMHYDELEIEIQKVINILYPKVIECILEDKVFDFSDLFSGKCNGGSCGGCGGCH